MLLLQIIKERVRVLITESLDILVLNPGNGGNMSWEAVTLENDYAL